MGVPIKRVVTGAWLATEYIAVNKCDCPLSRESEREGVSECYTAWFGQERQACKNYVSWGNNTGVECKEVALQK